MRRAAIAFLVAGAFALALVAAPGAGAQLTPDENETVVGAEIGDDVSDRTVETVVAVLETRLDLAGIDGHVATASVGGTQYVAVVTDADRETVTQLLRDQGRVEMVARFPVEANGSTVYREETLLTTDDFVEVGQAQAGRGTIQPHVPITLGASAARNYSQDLQEYGFTGEGIGTCPPDADRNPDEASGHCLYTVDDGEVLYTASMGRQLAQAMRNGEFVANPSFLVTTSNLSAAEQLSVTLRSGAYPVSLSVTDLPTAVESAALSSAENAATGMDRATDGSVAGTGATAAATTTDRSADGTAGPATGAVTETGALGPGFTPLAALLAVALGSSGLLAARLR
ncbi:hypothetical protein [Halorientalis pallida]|uniref:Uncharacterized protein n=1 Tax=Halorientalis pallida TaxID=2479928 RepID=A0A498L9K2_9EURY|nr:hypothetical protein [Halorientalis pallida]RXK51863.1 hypothetical protein EAF64_04310 [Halorientalis pallida]